MHRPCAYIPDSVLSLMDPCSRGSPLPCIAKPIVLPGRASRNQIFPPYLYMAPVKKNPWYFDQGFEMPREGTRHGNSPKEEEGKLPALLYTTPLFQNNEEIARIRHLFRRHCTECEIRCARHQSDTCVAADTPPHRRQPHDAGQMYGM